MKALMAMLVVVAAGCGADERTPTPPDLAVAGPCTFLFDQCPSTLAAARSDARCSSTTGCAGYDAVQFATVATELVCYYRDGMLADEYSTNDIGPTCEGRGAHAACGSVAFTACARDGGGL